MRVRQLWANFAERMSDLWGRCALLRMDSTHCRSSRTWVMLKPRKGAVVSRWATVTAHTGGHSSRTLGAVDLPSGQVVSVYACMSYSRATVLSHNIYSGICSRPVNSSSSWFI